MDILKRLFFTERGEVGDPQVDTDLTPDAPVEDQGTGITTDADGFQAVRPENTSDEVVADETQGEETFLTGDENLDPRKLDPALQPIFKRMQAAYTRRMQGVAEIRDKAATVDRFYTDPAFAAQTLQAWAAQNGYQITPVGQSQSRQQGQGQAQAGAAPEYLVELMKQNLDPALHWMAEPQAKAMWSAMQGMLAPVFQQHQEQTTQQKQAEWQRYADELSNLAPGWEEHEDTMGDLFDFLRSPALNHPKYGSKIQMLYDLATAKAASMKQVQQRVAQARTNRVSSGRTSARAPSIENEIAKAPTTKDAWNLAVKHAMAQHKPATA